MQSSSPTSACLDEQMTILSSYIANKDQASPAKDFETRVTSLINRVNTIPAAQNLQDGEHRHHLTADSLLELVKVTTQLSQLQQIADQTRGCQALSSDAKKWQEVTSIALDWSHKSLLEKQRSCIEKVTQLVKRSPDALPETPAMDAVSPVSSAPCPPKPVPAVQDETSGTTGFEQGETLRTHLEALAGEDSNRILIVRRINRLGFESPTFLEKHFSEYGKVSRVFVAHSRVKPSAKRPVPRVRPAGLGFVLMDNVEDANRIATAGPEMTINNVNIEVKLYQPGSHPTTGVDGEEKE